MHVGRAHAGAADPHEQLVRALDLWNRPLHQLQRLVISA
jgi:hypothetical protein